MGSFSIIECMIFGFIGLNLSIGLSYVFHRGVVRLRAARAK